MRRRAPDLRAVAEIDATDRIAVAGREDDAVAVDDRGAAAPRGLVDLGHESGDAAVLGVVHAVVVTCAPQQVVRQRIDGERGSRALHGAKEDAVGVGQVDRLHAPGRVQLEVLAGRAEILRPNESAGVAVDAQQVEFLVALGQGEEPAADRQRRAEEEGVGVLGRPRQEAGPRFLPAADLPAELAGQGVHGPQAVVVEVLLGGAEPVLEALLHVGQVLRVRRDRQVLDVEDAPAVAAERAEQGVLVQQGGRAAVLFQPAAELPFLLVVLEDGIQTQGRGLMPDFAAGFGVEGVQAVARPVDELAADGERDEARQRKADGRGG